MKILIKVSAVMLEKRNMTKYRLMEDLISDAIANRNRPSFELFKSNIRHLLKDMEDIPLCKNYNDIRNIKLDKLLFPSDVLLLCRTHGSDVPKTECLRHAIPELMRFNIVECELRNVC